MPYYPSLHCSCLRRFVSAPAVDVAARKVYTRNRQPLGEAVGASRNPVDVFVGARLRLRRTIAGFSQQKLGETVNLTFQQIQKYEKGANRVSASRMFQFAHVLGVSPAYFFEGIELYLGPQGAAAALPGFAETPDAYEAGPAKPDVVFNRESLELMRAFARISTPEVRQRLFELVKAVAEAENPMT